MRKDKALLRLLSNPEFLRKIYSPSISRTIPEALSSMQEIRLNEWVVVVVVCGIFLLLILSMSLQINGQIGELSKRQAMREEVEKEVQYWQGITTKYPNYRDGYFRLALLYYQLGESNQALTSVDKALILDPRFQPGISFKEKLKGE